jgi:hypothetical protein
VGIPVARNGHTRHCRHCFGRRGPQRTAVNWLQPVANVSLGASGLCHGSDFALLQARPMVMITHTECQVDDAQLHAPFDRRQSWAGVSEAMRTRLSRPRYFFLGMPFDPIISSSGTPSLDLSG